MKVYIITEEFDDWAENGGGLQGNYGVYDSYDKAKAQADKLRKQYGPDYYYAIEEWEVE